MTLHLTRDEADRLTADGRVVLFREGRWAAVDQLGDSQPVICLDRQSASATAGRLSSSVFPWRAHTFPPAEFVEAAKPCETCGGLQHVPDESDHWDMDCPACLDGKRRTAAVVQEVRGGEHEGATCWFADVTVATVVVEWGPLPVVHVLDGRTCDALIIGRSAGPELYVNGIFKLLTLPPDVDPATLVGQYALGIRKVEQ